MRRVVVTGLGVVTPLGTGVEKFWNAIKNGESGIDFVTRFDPSNVPCKIAGEVKDFSPDDFIDKKEAKRMDNFTKYSIAAAKMAIEDAKLDLSKTDKERMGVIFGVGIGGFATIEEQCKVMLEKGPGRVSPFFVPMVITNMAPGLIAIMTGAKGINQAVTTACASGTSAIGDSFRAISRGDADVIIAGGAEAPITELSFAGFCSMKAMSTRNENPKEASCPFDARRDGFVMGEGAAVLILEEYEHAKKRGAQIICEIAGYGATDDAYHITAPAPDGEGGARAMALAIKDANITPDMIDYINAHGTSTPYNDKFETMAIKTVFGEHAKKVAVSSTKSMTGHMLGAAGAVEAVICALSIRDGFIPATINYKEPDPECDLDYVPNTGRKQSVNYALSNSFGFGGHNATIILKKLND